MVGFACSQLCDDEKKNIALHRFSDIGGKKFIAPRRVHFVHQILFRRRKNLYAFLPTLIYTMKQFIVADTMAELAYALSRILNTMKINIHTLNSNQKLLQHHCIEHSNAKMKWAKFWRILRILCAIFVFLSHLTKCSRAHTRHRKAFAFNFAMVLVFAIMARGAKLNEIYDTIIKMSELTVSAR